MTAAVLGVSVLVAGAVGHGALASSRRGAVVGRLPSSKPSERPAGLPVRRRLVSPPAGLAAVLFEADLPLSGPQFWTAWLAALGAGTVVAGAAGGFGLAGVAALALMGGPLLVVRTRRGHADARIEQALPGALGGRRPLPALGIVAPPGRGRSWTRIGHRPGARGRNGPGRSRGVPGREPGRRRWRGSAAAGLFPASGSVSPPSASALRPVAPRPGLSTAWPRRSGSGWPWPPSFGPYPPRPASQPL